MVLGKKTSYILPILNCDFHTGLNFNLPLSFDKHVFVDLECLKCLPELKNLSVRTGEELSQAIEAKAFILIEQPCDCKGHNMAK